MKKVFLILAAAVLMIGLAAGCGNVADEAATQESLYEEKSNENDALQDETVCEMPEVYRNVLWQYAQAIREDVDWDTLWK